MLPPNLIAINLALTVVGALAAVARKSVVPLFQIKKGGSRPLLISMLVCFSERDRKLRADGSGWVVPATGNQRVDSRLRQFLLVSQVLAIDRQTVAVVSPQVADLTTQIGDAVHAADRIIVWSMLDRVTVSERQRALQ